MHQQPDPEAHSGKVVEKAEQADDHQSHEEPRILKARPKEPEGDTCREDDPTPAQHQPVVRTAVVGPIHYSVPFCDKEIEVDQQENDQGIYKRLKVHSSKIKIQWD